MSEATQLLFDTETTGAVVIGRNEGQRLQNCLVALTKQLTRIVYVDSGSTDNSVAIARALGVTVVELDMTLPFTAARARNAGAIFLLQQYPQTVFIQFVDGDCEMQAGWIEKAAYFLQQHAEYAVVCGRRRERFPEHSVYNRLCDIEWNTPVGEAQSCGGDALIRTDAYQQVNGYRDDLIAGEEPELCFRLRQQGWKVMRLDAEMTLHDAAMTRFSQWWQRAKRAGFAYAAGFDLHGRSQEHFRQKETRSIVIWGGLLPLAFLLFALIAADFLWFFLVYPLQILRLYKKYAATLYSQREALIYAVSNVLGKFPQFLGCMQFLITKYRGKRATLIEYK
ncbi:glycosyltransferase family 2 protein [Methylophaga sp. OBS4]|uniref:glycosyltransferase family 2 protein n=1 Tax=Methylophaga sp. OBS4 TaxID=2991935 RepID=UPI0022511AC5|nr:glycosyltransferase family A protein [Methylophaga sp. OBS4]MCX4188424.1 glycosyltransferase family 2 protein [Methylophaga sp. OBS4]